MNPVTTIPINTETAVIAEQLLDWIFQLNGRAKRGHALLAYSDVNDERQMRLRIAAELAFESFDELVVPFDGKSSPINNRNKQFLSVAEYCQKTYRVPWLWLDPTAVPTKPSWLSDMEAAYTAQPKRYMGTHLKVSAESSEVFLMPTSIYHMGAFNDCREAVMKSIEVPFELTVGSVLFPKSSKWRLVQPLKIVDELDFEKIWPEAAVVVGDATGMLIEKYRADGVHLSKFPGVTSFDPLAQDISIRTGNIEVPPPNGNGHKIDMRTKEGRALALQRKLAEAAKA